MKNLLFVFFFIFSFLNSALACLNSDTKLLDDSTYVSEDAKGHVPYGHKFYFENFENGLFRLDSLYKATKYLDYLSDKGVLLILLKRYEEAIKLYLEIEKIESHRYSTASNLGTAYELNGDNEKALEWIKKSLEIEPLSHNHSEWIHVKILEAKIKGEEYITTSFLLNTDFGKDAAPKTTLENAELLKLRHELFFQLNERVTFIKEDDKVVAQLLFDLGNIAFLLGFREEAKNDYLRAKEYGYNEKLIEERINELNNPKPEESVTTIPEKKSESNYLMYGAIALLVISGIAIIIYKRKKK